MKMLIVSANLGNFDKTYEWDKQNADIQRLTDNNFAPRKCMHPRLQAKIPKILAWQMFPNYDIYIWVDGSFKLAQGASDWLINKLDNADMVFFKHPHRNTVEAEYQFMKANIEKRYLRDRYAGDLIDEQYQAVKSIYADNILLCGGVFAYKNIPKTQNALKDWWFHTSRYTLNEQLSLPHVLKMNGINFNVIEEDIFHHKYFIHERHH